MSGSISDPGRNDEADADHLLSQADNHASHSRVGALCLVDRDRHRHQANCPSGDDSAHQDHGEIHSSSLQDTAHSSNSSTDLNSPFSAKSIHGEAALGKADGVSLKLLCL